MQLEKQTINIEVFDESKFWANDLIGSFSIGLGTLYKNDNHEYYR
jgi:Ca2+-dependent lipid-binding protein